MNNQAHYRTQPENKTAGHSQSVNNNSASRNLEAKGGLEASILTKHRKSSDTEFNNKGNRRLRPASKTQLHGRDTEDGDTGRRSSKSLEELDLKKVKSNPRSADRNNNSTTGRGQ